MYEARCQLCCKIFDRTDDLADHIMLSHIAPEKRCWCGKLLVSGGQAQWHQHFINEVGFFNLLEHTVSKCPVCDVGLVRFGKQGAIIHHIEDHLPSKNTKHIRCWCGKTFANLDWLGHLFDLGMENVKAHILEHSERWVERALS